ncbi:uncharacterized protein BJ212DRAFT_1444934 [Suillus subaureus]|uniref:Probable RNA polymerase II nuclear localization protein SLC7A6OS n=1 Tax=Suillus subaureus TaxID=48587 RepID=A0A9P7EI40_9AGAM|nr:uncharacterized protein BJ212DRAFT_1444934 [Suillus subaureus]KAG1822623.1 hypothetical protein BJ212DRAFT_1444934 [Suillus subaureus]
MMDAQPNNYPYTIVRIKRKRTDEPLDALVLIVTSVVESRVRRKKSKGGRDVFQFIQTVEETVWEDKQLQETLQNQISKLSQNHTENNTKPSVPANVSNLSGAQRHRQLADEGRRYTIVPTRESAENTKFATSPPKVISAKDVQSPSDFRMYDAVPADKKLTSPVFDSDMEKFLPMLQNYLRMNDEPSQVLSAAPPAEDYVWDVFYKRPCTLSEWNSVANIGTLEGLPPSLDDPYSSDSESEEEDDADEDSNAEEYYKNDYPDEDDSDDSEGSDIFHESSESEDDLRYDNPDEDNYWR